MRSTLLFTLLAAMLCTSTSGQTIGTEAEPNNLPANANILVLGSYAPNAARDTGCHINPLGDLDIYKVTVTGKGVLSINIPANATGMQFEIIVRDSASYTLLYDASTYSPWTASVLVCGGTYYIAVKPPISAASPNPYAMNVTFYPDATECNNTVAEAYPLNPDDTVTGYIYGFNAMLASGSFDRDFYKVVNKSCGFIRASIPACAIPFGLELVILDSASGMTLRDRLSGAGTTITDTATVPPGTYYVGVMSYVSGESSGNPYTLYVNLTKCSSAGVADAGIGLEKVEVFPNPSSGRFTVNILPNSNERKVIAVTDMLGRTVKRFETASEKEIIIDIAQPAGIYFLTVTSSTNIYTQRIILN